MYRIGSSTRRLSVVSSIASLAQAVCSLAQARAALRIQKMEKLAYLIGVWPELTQERQGCSAVSVPPESCPRERRSPKPKAISKQYTVQNGPMTIEMGTWHDMNLICASSLFTISDHQTHNFLHVQ